MDDRRRLGALLQEVNAIAERLGGGGTGPGRDGPGGEGDDPPGLLRAESLRQFKRSVQELTREERLQIIDEALGIIQDVYVHLPVKRTMYAAEPARRLMILRERLDEKSDRGFHDEMISIFHSLRDLHTIYVLPSPYHGKTAFLPFLLEVCYEEDSRDRPRYLVTKVVDGAADPDFRPGVEVTYWNGIPIRRAVELNAEREAGSNMDARMARGLESLTIRPMALSSPPDEEWVNVSYLSGGQRREARFEWQTFEPPKTSTGIAMTGVSPPEANALRIGVDIAGDHARRAKMALFAPRALDLEQRRDRGLLPGIAPPTRPGSGPGIVGPGREGEARPESDRAPYLTLGIDARSEAARLSKRELFAPTTPRPASQAPRAMSSGAAGDLRLSEQFPDALGYRRVPGPGGKEVGYIRIFTFMVDDDRAFVSEFVRIAADLPQDGLIIDVRGNRGGNIMAGERLLQVLTPRTIEPQRFSFVNSRTTLELCEQEFLHRWRESIRMAMVTGDTFSHGFPLDEPETYNDLGQQYQGPVVLITDALCYSTTDIFAAGFQDHEVGPILGTDPRTGAGGANVWEHRFLVRFLPGRFHTPPKGVSFNVSMRRCVRVGARSGIQVEDLGVEANEGHLMTEDDILGNNADLIAKAAALLQGMPPYALSAEVDRSDPASILIRARGRNISQVDFFADNRPAGSADVRGGVASIALPAWAGQHGSLELHGYDGGKLAVAKRLDY